MLRLRPSGYAQHERERPAVLSVRRSEPEVERLYGIVNCARAFSRYLESWPAGRSHQGLFRVGTLGARASRPPFQTYRDFLKMR